MQSRDRSVRVGLRTIGVTGVAALLVAFAVQGAAAKSGSRSAAAAAHTCLVMTGSGDPAFVKNFNPYLGANLPSTAVVAGAFYEPLMITTAVGGGHQYPWLARSWKWSNGNKTLTLNIAKGVKWSDGKPLTAADVVYTLTAGKQDKFLDQLGLFRPGTNVVSISRKGSNVLINLKTPDSQFIGTTLNRIFVVPQHIWSKVADPATFTNPNPVGSGPFTRITRFTTQDYVLSKNPHYWQAGMPRIPCVEYVQASSNDAALLLIQSGQADWTHNFVPNVESAYVAKDKAHYHSFYATTAFPHSLMLDTTQYPYSLPVLRKAISMAIDRDQIVKTFFAGSQTSARSFVSPVVPGYRENTCADACAYNPAAAKELYKQAGGPTKVQITYNADGGHKEWVEATCGQIARSLGVKCVAQPEAKLADLLTKVRGKTPGVGMFRLGWVMDYPSMEDYLTPLYSSRGSSNYYGYSNPKFDGLVAQGAQQSSADASIKLYQQAEDILVQDLPVIPLRFQQNNFVFSTNVQNVTMDLYGYVNLTEITTSAG